MGEKKCEERNKFGWVSDKRVLPSRLMKKYNGILGKIKLFARKTNEYFKNNMRESFFSASLGQHDKNEFFS